MARERSPVQYFTGTLTIAAWETAPRGEPGRAIKTMDGEVFWLRESTFQLYFKPEPDPFHRLEDPDEFDLPEGGFNF